MSSDWTRAVNVSLVNYVKGETDNTLRKYALSALAESKGRITYDWSGRRVEWRIKFRKHPMQGYADLETLTFPRRDRWKIASLDWRGYVHTDSVSELEMLENRGAEQVINLMDDTAKSLMAEVKQAFAEEFFIDGNLAANFKRYHGLESFFSVSGASSGGFVGTPNDSYAGLSTAPGAYGGTWTGTWPVSGTGDAQYDFFSPIVVDYTDTLWEATTDTWPNTCEEAISFGLIKAARNTAPEGEIEVVLLENELWRQFLNRQRDRGQIYFQANASNSDLVKFGFKKVFNFDGCDIMPDYGVPATVGYGINPQQMEIRCMYNMMWKPTGPTWEETNKSYRFTLSNWGNFCWNPKFHFKLDNIT